ncbi:putative reverse transcriptase domain-containing protein [Tanacetum coccineum]
MADHYQKWHDETSTRNKSSNTYDGLAFIQAQLNNLGREIKKVNERVYAAQVGCELCNGPHYTKDYPLKEEGKTLEEAYYTQFGVPFPQAGRYRAAALGFYQRDKGNTSYQERRQTMEESLNKFMVLQERGSGSLPSSTETNPRDHVKSITTTKEAETLKKDDKMPLIELSRATIPFPGRLKENGYDEKEVLKELKMIQVNSTKSATSLRRLLKEKSRIEEEIETTMNVHCSSILKDALPLKEKDLWSFTLPCSINNMCFNEALADLGVSVSVVPYLTFTNLGLGKLAPTKLIIELADKIVKRPEGIAENVLVGIGKFVFPIDFIVLDMLEDIKIPLILGRPFLSTAHAKIDVFKRKFALRIGNDKIVFKSDSLLVT